MRMIRTGVKFSRQQSFPGGRADWRAGAHPWAATVVPLAAAIVECELDLPAAPSVPPHCQVLPGRRRESLIRTAGPLPKHSAGRA